jgi:argininosuccinate lyase
VTGFAAPLGVGYRLKDAPAAELVDAAFSLEAQDGPLLHDAMCLADMAHAIVLHEGGVLPADALGSLLAALLSLRRRDPSDLRFIAEAGDAFTNREAMLGRLAPQAAGWLRAGRARREPMTVAYTMIVRGALLDVAMAAAALASALLEVAAANRTTLMSDYTYLQRAQPTTLGHYLLGFVAPILRDLDRLRATFGRSNLCPAGCGSTNGSRLAPDRDRLAALLGFDGLALHTRDAMWQPDLPIEIAAAATACLANAGRLAEDLQIWVTSEFGLAELADGHSRGSVIMAHKKNPYGLAFVRGAAREMIGLLTATAAHQTTPSGQVDNRIFTYGCLPRGLGLAIRTLRLLASIVPAIRFDREALEAAAHDRFAGATDLAEAVMARRGIDATMAHHIVGRAVRAASHSTGPITAAGLDAAASELGQASIGLLDAEIATVMDPVAIVATRTCPGGAAPLRVDEMLARFGQQLTGASAWVVECRAVLDTAERQLVDEASALACAFADDMPAV